jgi:hypothetical protein
MPAAIRVSLIAESCVGVGDRGEVDRPTPFLQRFDEDDRERDEQERGSGNSERRWRSAATSTQRGSVVAAGRWRGATGPASSSGAPEGSHSSADPCLARDHACSALIAEQQHERR